MKNCLKCNKEHDGVFGSGKYCSRSCANSRSFSEISKNKKRLANIGNEPSNKGKKTAWITTKCVYCNEEIIHRVSKPKKYHSECWKKSSGGYRIGSGRGKSGWYKGIWCDSSYELAWVIFQLENNIPFKKNKKKYEYEWNGKKRCYIPDFIQNGEIIEIKGFMTEQTKHKIKTIPNLKVLFKDNLKVEFEYVESKYGKDFIKLYENNPYKIKNNKCSVCGDPAKNIYCSRKCSMKGNHY